MTEEKVKDASKREEHPEKEPTPFPGTVETLENEKKQRHNDGEKTNILKTQDHQDGETMKLLEMEKSLKTLELTKEMELETLGPIENTSCGFGPVCQRFASAESYLVLFGLAAVAQGMYFTYSTAVITTMEKRFSLPSKISGFISTGNDVVQIVLSIHAAFLAGQGHRPRWIASGLFLSFLGCLITIIPHAIYGAGNFDVFTREEGTPATRVEDKTIELCGGDSSSGCGAAGDGNSLTTEQYAVICLQFLSQLLSGFANLMFYTVGYSYLDESVAKEKVPLYFAIAGCLRIFGPICGFALGGFVLRIWIDPLKTPVIGPKHPYWVGAWWIGYGIIGGAMTVPAFFMFFMPKMLPDARRRVLENLRAAAAQGSEAFRAYASKLRPAQEQALKEILPSLRRIMTNKIYMVVLINQVVFWFVFAGYQMFKAKYMEHQFKLSAAQASQYVAAAAAIASLVGWLGTGVFLSRFKPRPKYVIMYMLFLSAFNCGVHLTQMNLTCEQPKIHGMNLVLRGNSSTKSVTQSPSSTQSSTSYRPREEDVYGTPLIGRTTETFCMSACHCSSRFSPVCANKKHNFYSACHAGCTKAFRENGSVVLEDCTCAENLLKDHNQTISGEETTAPVVETGYCVQECTLFLIYLATSCLTKMMEASNRVPVNLFTFRCVDERDKDVGLGFFSVLLSLFSFVTAPVLVGWAIDQSCILWEIKCGKEGFCWLYDLDTYRYVLHGIPAGGMVFCFLTELLLLKWHANIDMYGDSEREAREKMKEGEGKQESGETQKQLML